MKNRRNVLTNAGGGGSRSTGKSRALDTNVILNSERTEAQSENVKQNCHAELADLRTVERSENRIASRLSLLEQSSLGETLRAWSKSKTVSASVPCRELPLTLARSRNKFVGMILKEIPSLRATEGSVAIHSTLVLRLAFSCSTRGKRAYVLSALRTPLAHANATARACNQERGLACRALDSTQGKPCSVALLGLAFTMAEILLSLTIIGVVAAITLPSLTGNINERTWNTQRKALYARMSQAIALMPAINGYGTLKEESSACASDAVDTAAETFVTNGLAKVLKINNICDNEHLEDCGITSNFTNLTGSSLDFPKTLVELNLMFNGNL